MSKFICPICQTEQPDFHRCSLTPSNDTTGSMDNNQEDRKPIQFPKGTRVRDIFTGNVYTVAYSYWQNYDGTGDWTIVFEHGGWNKSRNLRLEFYRNEI